MVLLLCRYIHYINTFQIKKFYIEQYLIPVYQVRDGREEEMYTGIVASLEFKESGYALVFLQEKRHFSISLL